MNRVVDSNFKVVEQAGFPVEWRWIHFYLSHWHSRHHRASSRTFLSLARIKDKKALCMLAVWGCICSALSSLVYLPLDVFFSMFNTACSQLNQTVVELDRFLLYWPELRCFYLNETLTINVQLEFKFLSFTTKCVQFFYLIETDKYYHVCHIVKRVGYQRWHHYQLLKNGSDCYER